MKKLFFSAILMMFCAGFINVASAAGKDLQKTYTWKYNINKDATISFDNYDCNLTIHVWDKAETEFHLMVDADVKSDEDAAVLDRYIQNLKFSSSAASVNYKDNFWESRNSVMGRMTMKLESGKTISLSEFSMKGEVWIPSGCRFELDSKYSEIHLEDFAGLLFIKLYNGTLYGGNLSKNAEIEDKYGSMEFRDMKDVKADLYNSKLQATSMGDLAIVSKYSKVTVTTAGRVNIDGYNDKYDFTKTGDLTFLAKYSDLKTMISGQVVLDCYEGSVNLKESKDISISSKYADFQFGVTGDITVSSSYNDKLVSEKLNSLKIDESKYCSYRIEELTGSVSESDGYEDKFTIMKTGAAFAGFSINGKYTEATLSLPKSTGYRFRAKIQYADLEMDESQLKSKTKIVEGSNLEYDAVKGTEKEGMPVIEVKGYQMGLKIVEL
jgi:hypothetical protein